MTEQLNIILVPHTHWDREWYQTFQQFRIRLVRAVDKLLDILDRDPDFSHFMLDGQTIVLDDYLEVRPEEEARLKKYARSGRISVGPWYVQPDEFLVSGESLVRNLQIGLRRASEFGDPMRIGYVPDCFGHIAQMPQILKGAGIESAVFWRGVGSEVHKSEFYWAAPDGTKVLVVHLADALGYSNARDMPLNPAEFVARVELLTAALLPRATTNSLLFMNGSDHLEPQDGLPAVIQSANERLAHIKPEHARILTHFAHADHPNHPNHSNQPDQPDQSSQSGQDGLYDSLHVRIGTLPEYVAAVQQRIEQNGEDSLQTLTGEMRSSQYSHLLPSVLSTRMWIKQQNAATEHLLERWVEPLTAWAWKLGAPYPRGLVELAWKYLLQNHPHDSICGCSIDQVHRENSVRFAQSQQIGGQIVAEAVHNLALRTDTRTPAYTSAQSSHTNREAAPIVVFNPAPGPRSEVVQAVVQLPGLRSNAVVIDERGQRMPYHVVKRWRQELGTMPLSREMVATAVELQGAQAPGDFIRIAESTMSSFLGIHVASGNPYVIASIQIVEEQQPGVAAVDVMVTPQGHTTINEHELQAAEQRLLALLQREDIHTIHFTVFDLARETIDFVAADLPAYGLKTYWVYPHGLPGPAVGARFIAPSSPSPTSIENEYYRVEAHSDDGTLAVTDKQTGAVYTGLNRFVDGGDVGDLYNYNPPAHDQFISMPIEPPVIEALQTPVRAQLHIRSFWSLPTMCAPDRASRGAERVSCPIVSEITLVPGVRRIDIHTSINNLAKDHRLRVMFPVPYAVDSATSEGAFEVRTRPIAALRPDDISEWLEDPVNCFPQKRFVDVSNGTVGLGILNRGLPEYEIVPDDAGGMAIALTLLRCVDWLSRGDLSTRRGHAGPMEYTPEGQCLGLHEFDYALVLHNGDWEVEDALVLREAQAFNTPVRVVVTEQHAGSLPSPSTLIEVEPRSLVVSAIKQHHTGEGIIVRLYNPLPHAVEAALRPGFATGKAFVTNLLEEPQEQLFWAGEEPLHIGLRASEIVTVLFL